MFSSLGTRWRTFTVSPEGLRRVAVIALAGLFAVVLTGTVVRLTGSGLGCDNWPRCGNTPFPEKGVHAFVEFGNRVIALIAIGLTVVCAVASRRVPGLPRRVSRLAALVAVGTVAQIPLGGATVILGLNPFAVMSHFLLALAILGVAVLMALEAGAFARGRGDSSAPRGLGWLSLALLPVCLANIVTGAFVTAAGPHPGSLDVSRLGNVADAAYIHVRATAVFGVGFLVLLTALARRRREARTELTLAIGVLILLLAQMGLGEYQWRSGVPSGAVLAHVALAAAVWSGLVTLSVRLVWAAGLTRSAALRHAMPAPRLP